MRFGWVGHSGCIQSVLGAVHHIGAECLAGFWLDFLGDKCSLLEVKSLALRLIRPFA